MDRINYKTFSIHAFFAIVTGIWVTLQYTGTKDGTFAYTYNALYALMAFYGGVCAIITAKEWGWYKSLYGKTIILIGCTAIAWSMGGFIWAFYNFGGFSISNFLNPQTIEDVPYPSWADLGFGLYFPFALVALITLARALGIKYILKDKKGKFILILVPILALVVTFFLYKDLRQLRLTDTEELITVLLNYYYNVGGAFIASLAFLIVYLSPHYNSGKLRFAIYLIAISVTFQYFADLFFTYRTYPGIETYYNGDFSDLLYSISLYTLSIGASKITVK